MSASEREFHIILWGASGFTGRLVAEYLLEKYGSGETLRWALAGRNQAKLEAVRDGIGAVAEALPILLADAADEASLAELVARGSVICTTVGPYAKYGSKLVAACARSGTHYCDLTGEVHWIRRMIDAHQDEALASGARIVHTCGFDCIPSDLGAFFLQNEMQSRHGVSADYIKYRVKGFSGGASGGTIASMLHMMEEAGSDPEVMRVMNEPYSINPKGQRTGPDRAERFVPAYDEDFQQWTAPFVMAGVNTKVVRRTNALLGYAYGADFRYDEATLTGPGPLGFAKGVAVTAGLAAFMGAFALGPIRRALSGRLPSPGEGPSKQKRENGYFDIRLWARHPSQPTRNLRARITGDRDPGYGSTSKMLGESAVCLALDPVNVDGGFWTPAAAMGELLLARLQENAGLRFTIEAG